MNLEDINSASVVMPEQKEAQNRLTDDALRSLESLLPNSWGQSASKSNDMPAMIKANESVLPAMELTGRHGGYYPYPYPNPYGHEFTPPTSRVNAFQYTVHDGKITVLGR